MYHFPGEYVTDFCIIQHEGLYHLFHIRGERWTWTLGYKELDLGHATSTDLLHWTPHEPVIPAGPPGSWDESGNWAPDIIEKDGIFYCYYTGSDCNNNQAIGLATSSDLFTWQKHANNPIVSPGNWSDKWVGRDVAGRDAMVYHDQVKNRYLLYYTATMADGRACLALAQSHNLIDWQDLGPTLVEEDRSYNRLESAYLVPHGDKYYLFYSAKGGPKSKGFSPKAFAHFDIVYVVSDDPTGGWIKPANHELLTEWTCASEHPTLHSKTDETYMLYIIQEEVAGVWGASSLSDPKRIEWLPDGTVRVREHLPATVERRMIFQGNEISDWVAHDGIWTAQPEHSVNAQSTGDSFLTHRLWGRDLALEAEVKIEADSVASLIVRGNPSALAGYRVSLDATRQVVAFYLRVPGEADRLIQERAVMLVAEQWHKLKVVVQGAFFDIYVDDTLSIVRHERTYETGCLGLHAIGTVQFRNLQAYQYTTQQPDLENWTHHLRPRHLQ